MKQPLLLPQDESNQTLLRNVHPPGWENPEPARCYNLVVIGAGTAGLVTAAGAAGLGAKVALVERHLLGGDCLNYGCVPSKALIRAARAIHDIRTSHEFGMAEVAHLPIDFAAIMERLRRVRAEISLHDSALRMRDEFGIDLFLGEGRFLGRDFMEVEGRRIRFKRAAICTGARPGMPAIPGLEEAGYLTNETVFSLTRLPSRFAVIGGGPLGCELAQAFARLGSQVSLLEPGGHILSREDPDAVQILQNSLREDGVQLCLESKILRATRRMGEKIVCFEQEGVTRDLPVHEILVGIGRVPNVEGLNLQAAGVSYDPKLGVKVNERLQTSNPLVFAAGDVCFPYKFTHTADALARILIANALFMGRQKSSALVIPWCTYTDPEVAHVGLYEQGARARGIEVHTLTVPLARADRAVLDGETEGFARIHLRKGTDRILGATVVARHAGEMINEISLAMTAKLGLSAIGKTIHPYPTQAEAIKMLADTYNRTRLTPFLKKILSGWFRWRRW